MTAPLPSTGPEDGVHAPTLLGWSARAISVILLLSLAGLVAWKAMTEDRPIAFEAKVASEELRRAGDQWLIPVDITNTGSLSAQFIVLEVTAAGRETEVDLDMMGAEETRRVTVTAPAAVQRVDARVVRYES